MKKMFYPESDRLSKAALVLASMSPDMVEDIIGLVNTKGRSLTSDLFGPDSTGVIGGQTRFMGMFSRAYITDADFSDVWTGWTTIAIANFRNPSISNDNYQKVLADAFSMPSEMAEAIAKQIETEDIIGAGKQLGIWDTMVAKLREGTREGVNWLAGVLNLPWEVDQTQKYDVDFLFEMKLLGEAVDKLAARARLMDAQVSIQKNMGLLNMGDVDGDVNGVDAMVGDTFRVAALRRLPKSIFGGAANIAAMGHGAARAKAGRTLQAAGYHVKPGGRHIVAGQASHPHLRAAVDKVLTMKPSQAMLAGAALGFTPTIISALAQRGDAYGDAFGDAYGTIETHYGPEAAEMWKVGDVEGMLEHIGDLAADDYSTGDAELDHEIDAQAAAGMGEIGDTEIGGIFKRARANRLRRIAHRRARRHKRKAQRIHRRDLENEDLISARKEADAARHMDIPGVNDFSPVSDNPENTEYTDTANAPQSENDGSGGLPSVEDFNNM